jgi:PKHD-type hydroxylase
MGAGSTNGDIKKKMTWINYPYYAVENALDTATIDSIIKRGQDLMPKFGTTDGSLAVDVRKSRIGFFNNQNTAYADIYRQCDQIIKQVNNNYFQYNLDALEPIQFTEYKDEYQGRYDYHSDIGMDINVARKLSFSLQLSDEQDYDGGDIEMFNGDDTPLKLPRARGTFIVFPSILWHRVTTVTRGTRLSLVGWYNGERFK